MEDYKLIDLGLPSGTLWMDRNIGEKEIIDSNLYFAWGETKGYDLYDMYITNGALCFKKDYKHFNGSNNKVTKYCSIPALGDNGYTDNITTLEISDDAAYQFTDGKCRMPTKEEIQELIDNTTYKWTEMDGVDGGMFTSKINGKSIFIPAGMDAYSRFNGYSPYVTIWSSSLHEKIPDTPYNSYKHQIWYASQLGTCVVIVMEQLVPAGVGLMVDLSEV